jgi:hypothetical protein
MICGTLRLEKEITFKTINIKWRIRTKIWGNLMKMLMTSNIILGFDSQPCYQSNIIGYHWRWNENSYKEGRGNKVVPPLNGRFWGFKNWKHLYENKIADLLIDDKEEHLVKQWKLYKRDIIKIFSLVTIKMKIRTKSTWRFIKGFPQLYLSRP